MRTFFLLTIFMATILSAKTYTIYVNSLTTDELTYKRWNPTIEFLNEKIKNHTFKLLSIKPTEIVKIKNLLAEKKIDFLITQPAIFAELEYTNGINRTLTMTNTFGMNKFGSVLITHKDNNIENILDIRGKTVAAVAPLGFGGWLIAYSEMLEKGIDPLKDDKVHFVGSQKKTIDLILNKKYDVGVIRTGMLENLSNNHNLDISNIKIINEIPSEYPLKISTQLYPEWAFATARHINDYQLENDVFRAMNSITKDSKAAVAGQYQAWGPAQNYNNVDKILKKFKLAHYKDMKNYNGEDIVKITVFILLLAILFLLYTKYRLSIQMHRELKEELEDKTREIKNINTNLREEVKLQTNSLRKKDESMIVQSRMAQMGEMISMIAHQWRQPLGAISSTSIDLNMKIEMEIFDLEHDEGRSECQAYISDGLEKIDLFVKNLTTTIDDFRNFYKPEKQADFSLLSEPSNKALNIVRSSFVSDGIEIVENFISNKKVKIYSNEFMQVILNILKNAQDNFKERATKNPKITITCKDSDDKVIIEICDNGGGIPEDIMPKIFDPYFSTKDEKNGTGLGLHMSKTIVEEHHNGKLQVSNRDSGVCFRIILNREI